VRPLVALALILVVVCLKILSIFVERVIGKMRVQIFFGGEVEGVGRSSESRQSLLIDINPQGVPAGDSDIDPHIEFESVGQQGAMNVLADNDALFLFLQNFLCRIGQPDAFTLGAIVRFDYVPMFFLLFLCIVHEHAGLVGQDEGLGEEVVLSLETVLHLGQVLEH
jgi:hypothetical protein